MHNPFGKYSWRSTLLLLLLVGGSADAADDKSVRDVLRSIRRLYDGFEYEQAFGRIKVARSLQRRPADDVALSLYEGILLCEMGDFDQGASAFRSAILVMPEVKLPVKVAPKIAEHFENIRRDVQQERAAATQRGRSSPRRRNSFHGERLPWRPGPLPPRRSLRARWLMHPPRTNRGTCLGVRCPWPSPVSGSCGICSPCKTTLWMGAPSPNASRRGNCSSWANGSVARRRSSNWRP